VIKTNLSNRDSANYLAQIIKIAKIEKHPNADRLQVATVNFQTVITGLDAKVGDLYVYFPLECSISKEYLGWSNSFRDKGLNADEEQAGFFEKNGRVKAVKLRGSKSMGYIVPIGDIERFAKEVLSIDIDLAKEVGTEFNEIGGHLLCQKYISPKRNVGSSNKKKSRKPKVSRLVDGQFKFHIDTSNLRKNIHEISPEDTISISYKVHGTSAIFSNVLVHKKLGWFSKLLRKCGVPILESEYDTLYSSRRVVKNDDMDFQSGFYKEDIWGIVNDEIKDKIPPGFTIYGEIIGYTPNGQEIQKGYDYGCGSGEHKFFVYRITQTNVNGLSTELSTPEIIEFCELQGLTPVPLIYYGLAKNLYNLDIDSDWHTDFITQLEVDYNDKNCYMCNNKVPEEGIVVRRESSMFSFDAWKLKSWKFLERETKQLDQGVADMESEN